MGWWSKTVTGGDTPYDILSGLYHTIDEENIFVELTEDQKKQLITKLPEFISSEHTKIWYCSDEEDTQTFHQVLGHVVLTQGLSPKEDVIKDIIKQAITSSEEDFWARDDEERKQIMTNFANQLKQYDGTKPKALVCLYVPSN